MFTKRVLLLTDYHIEAYHITRGRIVRDVKLDVESDYWPTLKEFLSKDLRSPIYLVSNILEEEFHSEKMPHTRGSDQKHLLDRKLKQVFRNASFANYRVVGREKTGRKDDLVMFYALHESEHLRNMLDHIYELELSLSGIYSVPLLIQECLKDILTHKNILVLSEIDNHTEDKISFRQCFFSDGVLSLTRVSTFTIDEKKCINEDLSDEVKNSRRYLMGHKLLNPNDKITALILESDHTLAKIDRIELPEDFEIQYAKPESIGDLLGLDSLGDDDNVYFDDVLAGDLCRRNIRCHHKTDKSQFHFRHHKARWYIAMSSLALAASIVTLALMLIIEGFSIKQGNEQLRASLSQRFEQIELMETKSPVLPQKPKIVEAAVLSVNWLQHHDLKPDQILSQISQSLHAFPDIIMHEITWQKESEGGSEEMLINPEPYDDYNSEQSLDHMALAEDTPLLPDIGGRSQEVFTVTIRGEKSDFAGNLRHTLERIHAFSEALQQNEHVIKLTVEKLPKDLSAEASVNGEISSNAQSITSEKAEFKFEMTIVKPLNLKEFTSGRKISNQGIASHAYL